MLSYRTRGVTYENDINYTFWPTQSPDLNPVNNVGLRCWTELSTTVFEVPNEGICFGIMVFIHPV